MSLSGPLPRGVRRRVEARAFLIQGSWNYRVMQGTGMAFAMLPVLRHLGLRGADLDEALGRHAEHFNAHPYLTSVALGALSRLECDGATPETVRRFRAAIRGPLGALGDRVVWVTWLPLAAVIALLLYWSGRTGLWAVAALVVLYNGLHLTMRFRGFQVGFESGTALAGRLRTLDPSGWSERVGLLLILLVGALAGLLLRSGASQGGDLVWTAIGGIAFLLGLFGGVRLWRPTAILTVGIVVVFTLLGLRAS